MNLRKTEDFQNLVGAEIGRGSARRVYERIGDPFQVIKVSLAGDFSNVMEWWVWDRFRYCSFVSEWLAPCFEISECGRFMTQSRTRRVSSASFEEYPEKLPNWMTDVKMSNFGMFQGRFVAHDYASHLLLEKGATRRMRKVSWDR